MGGVGGQWRGGAGGEGINGEVGGGRVVNGG